MPNSFRSPPVENARPGPGQHHRANRGVVVNGGQHRVEIVAHRDVVCVEVLRRLSVTRAILPRISKRTVAKPVEFGEALKLGHYA